MRVVLDTPEARRLWDDAGGVLSAIAGLQCARHAGSFAQDNQRIPGRSGQFFTSIDDLQQVVVGVHQGRPVYLRDVVAKI